MFAKFARHIIKRDKRKDRRIPTKINATMGNIQGRVTDISLGGCGFYPNSGSLMLGQEAAMVLHLGDDDIHIPAKVAGHDLQQVVYGVAFLELTPKIFSVLEQIITKRITPAS